MLAQLTPTMANACLILKYLKPTKNNKQTDAHRNKLLRNLNHLFILLRLFHFGGQTNEVCFYYLPVT